MSDILKNQVKKDWATGNYTKAELARKYNVSPRTVGRWLEGTEAKSAPVKQKPAAVKTTAPKPLGKHTAEAAAKLNPADQDWLPEHDKDGEEVELVEVEYSVVATPRSVSITKTVDGKVEATLTVDKTAPLFENVLNDLKTHGVFDQKVLADCYLKLKPAEAIKFVSEGRLEVDVKTATIHYTDDNGKKEKLNIVLGKKIIDALKKEGKLTTSIKSMLKFLENLMLNPSYRAVNELYGFLEANDIQLTEDGHFLAWKKVRNNYLDIHSGTISNKPGERPSVPRRSVDENSERTCSYGLHVCSKSYLPHFSSAANDRVLRVKVNPAHVVAIPKDYNNAKLRCCEYEVLEDVTNSKEWR